MTFRLYKLVPMALALAGAGEVGMADEGVDEDTTRRCINIGHIRQTKVIDDSHVVFMMRGDRMYLNKLRDNCVGLSRSGTFSYSVPTRSLCELNWIRVMNAATVGLGSGRSCSLGRFEPVTMDDLLARFQPLVKARMEAEVEPPDIEEVVDEEVDTERSETE